LYLGLFLSRNDAITTPSLFFGTAKRRELIAHVEGHITLTSLASFRGSLTFVSDGLIEDIAALLELQWHQVVLTHSLATCSAISLFTKLDHKDKEYREWRLHAFKTLGRVLRSQSRAGHRVVL
jgi:hypothetical protein